MVAVAVVILCWLRHACRIGLVLLHKMDLHTNTQALKFVERLKKLEWKRTTSYMFAASFAPGDYVI